MKNTYKLISYFLLLTLLTFGIVSCSDNLTEAVYTSLDNQEAETRACNDCPIDTQEPDDPFAYAYKLIIETGDWNYTGQIYLQDTKFGIVMMS